ncbi:DUF397 domain-containing protein [Streptomyces sp. RK75]|uniref:DUF397 domain-containing protein n=1 Tax=Streptomyces sp. RK75 TaxID=2824895 RepID=UPI00161E7DDC|nr:DUF397 domain-containing protein [Streptomyces sp. RK75]MBQ0865298.1 DUF397 domain-containing protein [Streptomyces sp. RK75]
MRRHSPTPHESCTPAWRTSTYSGGNGDCIEVATNLPRAVPVRDTKQRLDADRPTLVFGYEAWARFVGHIR